MAFELDILEQVVNGSLAPWLFPQDINTQKHLQEYLQAELNHAIRQVHARYRQQEGQWIIREVESYLFDRRQLPAFLRLQHEVQVPEVEGEVLLELLLEELSTDQSTVSEWYHWQDETREVQLEAYLRIAWESLSYEEQRYCFYQQLLTEQLQLAEQNIRDFVHTTATRQAAEIYLQKHQQALLRYADQLKDNLGTDQAAFTPSGSYRLTDVMQLILQQVDRFSGFLIREFAGYLDPDLPVPHSYKVLTVKKHQVLLEELSGLVNEQIQDVALQKLLQEVLTTFKALPSHPTSLRQLKYWQVFLPELNKLLKSQADTATESEYYLTGLTAINFNHPEFFAWCRDLLEHELNEQYTTSGKLDRLYYFQKLIRQVRLLTEFSFMPKQASLQAQLSDWIQEEIIYYQQMVEKEPVQPTQPIQSTQQAGIESIPTNMTVAQVALLLRLLQETDLLPKQNKARMFRAFSKVLLTQNQQEIAAESLKAKYNQLDEHSIRVLKEKVKAMLDLLNHPTHWQ